MSYYFLDGLDKKGPYTEDEIRSRNLPSETLIWSEQTEKWEKIEGLSEFQNPKLHKPAAIIADARKVGTELNLDKIPNGNKRLIIPSSVILIISNVFAIFISVGIANWECMKDKQKMNQEVSSLLQGKDEICDYEKIGVEGNLFKVRVELNPISNWISVMAGKRELAHKPEANSSGENDYANQEEEAFNFYKKLVEYYECESGGFEVYTLTKQFSGFDRVISSSSNMAYKVPESNYEPGKDFGYGLSTPGYSIPTYRGSIDNAYTQAAKFLTSEKENESYVPGTANKISNFGLLSTKFYHWVNKEPSGNFSKDHESLSKWKETGIMVYNTKWIVWYNSKGTHFELEEIHGMLEKTAITYSLIAIAITTLLFFVIRHWNKITFN